MAYNGIHDWKSSASDKVNTELGEIRIGGWDNLLAESPNRAFTLLAMIQLEIEQVLHNKPAPTQVAILERSRELGAELGPTSQQATSRHIQKLIDLDHVVLREDYDSPKRGRGGPASPWSTRYVSSMLAQLLKKKTD